MGAPQDGAATVAVLAAVTTAAAAAAADDVFEWAIGGGAAC